MSEHSSGKKRSVVMSDRFLAESGIQGGKVLGHHLWLVSFVVGIPFLVVGIIALIGIVFDVGFPSNTAVVFASVLIVVIGGLLVFGGYSLYQSKCE